MQIQTYRNNRNRHKYLEVARYDCGHFYICQYIRYAPAESASGEEIVNYTGTVRNRRRRDRWKKARLLELLADYSNTDEGGQTR